MRIILIALAITLANGFTSLRGQELHEMEPGQLKQALRKFHRIKNEHENQLKTFQETLRNEIDAGRVTNNQQILELQTKHLAPSAYREVLELYLSLPKTDRPIEFVLWVKNHASSELRDQAHRFIIRDFPSDHRLMEILPSLVYQAACEQTESLIQHVLAESKNPQVRLVARQTLGNYILEIERLKGLDPTDARDAPSDRFRRYVEQFEVDPRQLETLFESVIDDYPAAFPDNKRPQILQSATETLRGLRLCAVGKTAPEITGFDLANKPLHLRDFRGRVVVLFFWSQGCAACHDEFARLEKQLGRFSKQQVAMVGVCSDPNREKVHSFAELQGMTGPNFWDGERRIFTDWNVRSWPTIHILDAMGKIRFKHLRGSKIDAAVAKLIQE
ncbi:MAG: TlpA disulfide reductase family protein [Planctomycetota bacterium]